MRPIRVSLLRSRSRVWDDAGVCALQLAPCVRAPASLGGDHRRTYVPTDTHTAAPCVRARTYARESAYVISDPGGDPGIRSHHTGLSTPTTVHHRQREAPLCTPNDTRVLLPPPLSRARDIVARVAARFEAIIRCASIRPT